MNIFFILLLFTIFRLFLANLFPLTADESYYWLWSRHLSLSYVDHPPMVALINYLTTLGKANLFLLRLGPALITWLISITLYHLARGLFNEKVAFWSAIIFQIIPHFLVIWLTMFVEVPLGLFWISAVYLLYKITRTSNLELRTLGQWLLLGIIIGLGCLSKYTMFLFWPCLAIFFYLVPEQRYWLKRPEPYLCFLLSAFCFLPVILWNAQNNWVSFTFHAGKASADPWGAHLLEFIGDQLVHFTPFLIFALYNVWSYALKQKAVGYKLLLAFSLPLIIAFLALSLKIKVWAHWPAVGYITAIPLTVAYILETGKSLKRFMVWLTCFSLLILFILFFLSPGIALHQKEYANNYKLAAYLPNNQKIFAGTNVTTALLEFYSQRSVFLATGFLMPSPRWGEKQYELWGIPNLAKGENIIYFGENNSMMQILFNKHFLVTEVLPNIKIGLIEDYITENYYFIELKGFKGPPSHP